MYSQQKQKGNSIIGLIIGLIVIGMVTYVGIQYIPQYIESTTVGSILDNIGKRHKTNPFSDTQAIQNAIENHLNINELDDLKEKFTVIQSGETYTVTVSYERELDLGYTKKLMKYEKDITLR